MATYTPVAGAANFVQIDGVQILPNSVPTIAVGDIARITVRQNSDTGQGTIYYQGQLINAQIPANLQVGDKLLAQLINAGPQLVFQILEQLPSEHPITDPSISLQGELLKQLESLFQGTSSTAATKLPQLTPVQIPDGLQQQGINVTILQNLLSTIGSAESLADPTVTLSQLLASTKGDLPTALKNTAQAIRTFLTNVANDPNVALYSSLRDELASLLSNFDGPNIAHRFQTILSTLDDEIRTRTKLSPTEKQFLQSIRDELGTMASDPATHAVSLQAVLTQLDARLAAVSGNIDPKTLGQLQQLATRLEQMGSSAQLLNQLNPLMQALGEPALILFPFLFQGLLTHTRVTVDTPQVEDEEPGKGQEQDPSKKKKKRKEAQPFNRIQVTVPLPSLGTVDVDVAHRPQEIYVRLTVQDKEVAQFLLEQLEHLATILREQGYSHAELVANVGERRESFPSWALSLSSSTSVVA